METWRQDPAMLPGWGADAGTPQLQTAYSFTSSPPERLHVAGLKTQKHLPFQLTQHKKFKARMCVCDVTEISDSHGREYEDDCLLECCAM
jgi:hypothetical protein